VRPSNPILVWKKDVQQNVDGWDTPNKVRTHMVFHLSYADGDFGVTFKDITKDTVFYTNGTRTRKKSIK
jgi:hypothetical protein